MNDILNLRLLGGFAVFLDDRPIRSFRSAKARALLAYLATQPDRDHSRDALAALLWGDLPDSAARTNLRVELSNLKQALSAHPALEISRSSVRFHGALAATDAQEFRKVATSFLALPAESQGADLPRLSAAVERYEGEFLAGFHVSDAPEFEDWQLIAREQLHELVMQALDTLQLRYAEQGRWPELRDASRRQLAVVPWTESAHRNLMQALAAEGQTQAALEQYAKCCEILRDELGVEPSVPTQELAARLRGERRAPSGVQHNLGRQSKSFVGRKQEIAHLGTLIRTERLVTLLGIGGVGKSHLALAVAQNALRDFADGVWFVPMVNVEAGDAAPDRIVLAIAAAVGCQVTDVRTPLEELTGYLSSKRMLLVLDNCEHLVEAAAAIFYSLLQSTPVHILATSRVRLTIEGEIPVQLAGLPLAEASILFEDRARRIVPSFSIEPADGSGAAISNDLVALCEHVAGLPLGVELAASWVEHFSVAEIAQSIAQISIAPEQSGNLVGRHHRLIGVFEYSWQLLNPRQQMILSRLSVFRGGFDRTAAGVVAESSLTDLSTLIAHSLVQRVSAGRYDLHRLIQDFLAGKLNAEDTPALLTRHHHYYLTELILSKRAERTSRLRIEFDNIRSGWQRAVFTGDHELIERSASRFGEFMWQLGFIVDGHALLADAILRFEAESEHDELVAQLLREQATFVRGLQGAPAMTALHYRILTLTRRTESQAKAHQDLAYLHSEMGEWEKADFHFDRMERLAQESTDLASYISSVEGRIHTYAIHFRGDFAWGVARLKEMLRLLDGSVMAVADAELLRGRLLQSLSLVAIRHGDYGLAIRTARVALAWASELELRMQRCHILLDLALGEQFAGMYAEAVAHNEDALAWAEEIGDVDEAGLLHANLCLTLRQSDVLEQALSHGLRSIEILRPLGKTRVEGQARNRVGHTLLALERWADAYTAYGEALVVWEPLHHPNHYEAVAGRAASAFHLGKRDEALAGVEETLAFVARAGLVGIVEPARLLLNCETVLSGMGRVEEARRVLAQAESWIRTIASRISDDAVRASFLLRPDNQLVSAQIASLDPVGSTR